MKSFLQESLAGHAAMHDGLRQLSPTLEKLGQAMFDCWQYRGKVLTAGNGGSACDAIHLAEELSVRYHKTRRALAAVALADAGAISCAGNDFGFESVFQRQVEALGNPGDILIVFTTSGNSANVVKAVEQAKLQNLKTASFLGKDGGKLRGQCDFELLVPSLNTARVQEGHLLLYHTLCEWIDSKV